MTSSSQQGAEQAAAKKAAAEKATSSLGSQLSMMIRALRGSPVARTLVALCVAAVVVIAATAYGQIRLNSWNKPFYDALSRRDLHDFVYQLGVFAIKIGRAHV